jgi:hypothetical protein
MNKQEMEAYLVELDEALAQAFPSPEPIRVMVVGGACLLLSDITERPTEDIDVIITDLEGTGEATLVWQLTKTTKKIRQIITGIGKQHGLPPRERLFLNDDCAPFLLEIGDIPPTRLWRAYRKLYLYVPADFGYILACKLMAGRPNKDFGDIAALRQLLNIKTREEAQTLVDRFFPKSDDQQIYGLAETLSKVFAET